MNIMLMYQPASEIVRGMKVEHRVPALWETFLDTGSKLNLPFGEVTIFQTGTKPTKRQLRKFKHIHRVNIAKSIAEHEFNNSWEGIHCDVMGM